MSFYFAVAWEFGGGTPSIIVTHEPTVVMRFISNHATSNHTVYKISADGKCTLELGQPLMVEITENESKP